MFNNLGKKIIHTGGTDAVTYDVPSMKETEHVGKTWTVVNAGTGDIDLNLGGGSFTKLYSGGSQATGLSTIKLLKGGVAELVVIPDGVIVAFGSGLI